MDAFEEHLDFDRKHVWHPYARIPSQVPIYPVKSAEGVRITLEDGRQLIDGIASWWTCIHGYNHPVLNKAATDQIAQMSHVMFGGLTHRPAIELSQKLIALTPPSLQQIFYSDSGSVSVEVAMKMAIQYWSIKNKKSKTRFLTIRNGYHGDTFAAMSVCDPDAGMHHQFRGMLFDQFFADAPQVRFDQDWDQNDIKSFAALIEKNHDAIAAVILEPIVQNAGGVRFYHPEYLRQVRALCDRFDVLLILDEIATGFGRTGRLFACEHGGIEPDILCIGKALTGGFCSLAATLTTEEISRTFAEGEAGVLMHGPTFMANPLACAVALANLNLLTSYDWQARVQQIEVQLNAELEKCRTLPQVNDVRILGAIGAVELKQPVDMAIVQPQFVERGVWLRPFGKLVYTMPPYIIEADELSQITQAIYAVIKSC